MAAVDRQKPRAVATLLRAGADPNAKAEDGASPVSLAVENDRVAPHGREIMMALFQAGGHPDTRRPNGDPVLMKFVNLHDCDGIRLMKSLGADLDIRDRGNDPVITRAALGMDWDVVWCLIELGARFDYEHGDARQPLSRSLANKAPSRSSPMFAYKEKVWQKMRDAGLPVAPLPG
jgi:ankyrin repeat protein